MRKKTPSKSRTGTRSRRIVVLPAPAGSSDSGLEYALFRYEVCRFFDGVRSACAGLVESGGILIGSYRGPHIDVVDCTEPGVADEATLSSFTRQDKRHQVAATQAWRKTKRKQTYVGEWHSHPYGEPVPSGTDKRVWQSVVGKMKSPCLFVVVSPIGWRVFRIGNLKRVAGVVPLAESEHGSAGIVFR